MKPLEIELQQYHKYQLYSGTEPFDKKYHSEQNFLQLALEVTFNKEDDLPLYYFLKGDKKLYILHKEGYISDKIKELRLLQLELQNFNELLDWRESPLELTYHAFNNKLHLINRNQFIQFSDINCKKTLE